MTLRSHALETCFFKVKKAPFALKKWFTTHLWLQKNVICGLIQTKKNVSMILQIYSTHACFYICIFMDVVSPWREARSLNSHADCPSVFEESVIGIDWFVGKASPYRIWALLPRRRRRSGSSHSSRQPHCLLCSASLTDWSGRLHRIFLGFFLVWVWGSWVCSGAVYGCDWNRGVWAFATRWQRLGYFDVVQGRKFRLFVRFLFISLVAFRPRSRNHYFISFSAGGVLCDSEIEGRWQEQEQRRWRWWWRRQCQC